MEPSKRASIDFFVYSSPKNVIKHNKNSNIVGNFELCKQIGNGAFGEVCIAKHIIFGVTVAVKVLNKSKIDEKSHPKVLREIKLLRNLHHPNIVKLYQVIETSECIYLFMENCEGGELFNNLIGGRCTERKARKLMRPVISAIKYCHANNVVHRDLKAENILLNRKSEIRVVDFGFGNEYRAGSKLNTYCGSPPYAAPELFTGKRYEGPEVDIWALGVLIYCITTNVFPFEGDAIPELRQSVIRGKYKVPYYMSHELEDLLIHMLNVNMDKRYDINEVCKHRWINEGFENDPIKSLVDFNPFQEIRNDALEITTKLNFRRRQVKESLDNLTYDDAMGTYLIVCDIIDGNLSVKSKTKENKDTLDLIKKVIEQNMQKQTKDNDVSTTDSIQNELYSDDDSILDYFPEASTSSSAVKKIIYQYGKPVAEDENKRSRAGTINPPIKDFVSRQRSNTVEASANKTMQKFYQFFNSGKTRESSGSTKRDKTSGIGSSLKGSREDADPERKKLKKAVTAINIKSKTSRTVKEFWPHLLDVLGENNCTFTEYKPYSAHCSKLVNSKLEPSTMIVWKIKLRRLVGGQIGVYYRRISGSSFLYKNLMNHIKGSLKL